MRIEVSIEVSQDMADAIRNQTAQATQSVLPTMVEEMEKVRTLSMEVVPEDQGILRASALEVGTNIADVPGGVEVAIGYGGAARSYAVMQHETPPDVFSHAPGKSWKYLERPALESVPQISEAMTAAIQRAFSGGAGTGEFGDAE